ncbi:hypothetical protein CFC21_056531 [Triticum aestivum]|uniref:Epidermal patterning factor-like protein n=3 Tax=Triticum TaxID=4564 RepID=A0A9R0SUZ5_TRITD|nr:EPIDERMAL PATTERNING FACTOR-like protein 2 [Triticum dicoccoides]XP_044368235.1 EPIDERMAL PATTERNING FACTOR-like protein 2 [Triticum aestivum]KAF7047631.1 hypothetical protein CFC21_056531 [Triticum aestivum]VAI01964.1 unnamed protein product [Triticum turgidum subsp. durum]
MKLLLLYSSLLLLLLLSPQGLASTQGRGPMHYQLKEPASKVVEGAEAMSAVRIGSRPPRCEGRCALCGRCEAVQVPVAPRDKGGSHFRLSGAFGGDDDEGSTNYKPLNWKCRCADRRPILNP